MRAVAIVLGIVFAAATGLVVGYVQWGTRGAQVEHVEQRLQVTTSELTTLREQKQELEQRLEAVNKEQERLAQENEILRKQRATEQVVGGQPGELPALPPK